MSSSNLYAILKDLFESVIHRLVADPRIVRQVFATLVAKLDPDEVLMVIGELAENAILCF